MLREVVPRWTALVRNLNSHVGRVSSARCVTAIHSPLWVHHSVGSPSSGTLSECSMQNPEWEENLVKWSDHSCFGQTHHLVKSGKLRGAWAGDHHKCFSGPRLRSAVERLPGTRRPQASAPAPQNKKCFRETGPKHVSLHVCCDWKTDKKTWDKCMSLIFLMILCHGLTTALRTSRKTWFHKWQTALGRRTSFFKSFAITDLGLKD